MNPDGLTALTNREKDILRLLLAGHDAKSTAAHLDLSVHTVNERLREARRKLAVSSSREAARLLAASEHAAPNSFGPYEFGLPASSGSMPFAQAADHPSKPSHRLAWFGGGMLIMSFIIAAAILTSVVNGNAVPQEAQAVLASTSTAQPESLKSASDWAGILDRSSWNESWQKASPLFKAGVSASVWAEKAQAVRKPLGTLVSRKFKDVTKASSLPGAPNGRYEIVQFQTNFSNKAGAVETVIMMYGDGGWKTAGYFIR